MSPAQPIRPAHTVPLLGGILIQLLWAAMAQAVPPSVRNLAETYCASCHDAETKKGDLDLEALLDEPTEAHSEVWEQVIRKLEGRQMPPSGKKRPTEGEVHQSISDLITRLDAHSLVRPPSPPQSSLRRLTRAEYQNAVRDLFGLSVDIETLLPADTASHGFDNVGATDLSPALLDRYLSAAQSVARLVVSHPAHGPQQTTIRVRSDLTQEDHLSSLPFGTRGGIALKHHFPAPGRYEVNVRLHRDRNEMVEGMTGKHQLEVLLNKQHMGSLTVKPAAEQRDIDSHLTLTFHAQAGVHDLGLTFVRKGRPVLERLRQPYQASYNFHRHPRLSPAIFQVVLVGPLPEGPSTEKNSPGTTHIIGGRTLPETAEAILNEVFRPWASLAYRRVITETDLAKYRPFFQQSASTAEGLEMAVAALLVSREFLFKRESSARPSATDGAEGEAVISPESLASRLSFFLWGSLPDLPLIDAAASGQLAQRDSVISQVNRLLKDPRSDSLILSFADQWLYLRNLDTLSPDGRLFPDFDHNLREAFRLETRSLLRAVLREDLSVLALLKQDRTWVNERLAAHYGIPHVVGSRLREVPLEAAWQRGGLLRHGSLLSLTSYATRTSPVIRGDWVLKNILGSPTPPPPPDVPALDGVISDALPMRERLAQHRSHATCASCHVLMDPIGFSLENFDAIGRWRSWEGGQAVDAEGGFSDGSTFSGVQGLEDAVLRQPEHFVRTLAEKLLTYALGRGLDAADAPAIRRIIKETREGGWRFSSLIQAVATSEPMRRR